MRRSSIAEACERKRGASLAHLSGDDIRVADILRRPAHLEGNERIEAGAKAGEESPPLRLVDQGPHRGAAQPGDLLCILQGERGLAAFSEFHPRWLCVHLKRESRARTDSKTYGLAAHGS